MNMFMFDCVSSASLGRLGFPGSRSAHWSNHWDNALPREGKEESQ